MLELGAWESAAHKWHPGCENGYVYLGAGGRGGTVQGDQVTKPTHSGPGEETSAWSLSLGGRTRNKNLK